MNDTKCPKCGHLFTPGEQAPPALVPPPAGRPAIKATPAEIAVFKRLAAAYYNAEVRPDWRGYMAKVRERCLRQRPTYEEASAAFNGKVPWWVFAICQEMEASGDLTKHMHNGDSLSRPTVLVPAGRPFGWAKLPPQERTWVRSAIDAAKFDGLDADGKYFDEERFKDFKGLACSKWADDVGEALDAFERFNGLGYRSKGVPSPYLFSFTTAYTKGKYIRDRVYDPNVVSKQPGVAFIMKALDIY